MPCYANQSLSQLSEENIGAAMSAGTLVRCALMGMTPKAALTQHGRHPTAGRGRSGTPAGNRV